MTQTSHRLVRMTGRDTEEPHRPATPLELLFDLTFVVAFGAAGNELAHAFAAGHVGSGVVAFSFCAFAICWAWINFSWFASAFDTDDWAFRVLTMVQMVGVIVLALGIPEVFASVDGGERLDNGMVVAGYVVMRVAMCALWLRVYVQDPRHRGAAGVYLVSIVTGQVLWCLLVLAPTDVRTTLALAAVPYLIELSGPVIAERRYGGTPWHPHHIAERYGLLTIIALGEGVIGTVTVMSVLVHDPQLGWSIEAAVVLASGIALTFGLWWTYFMVPWAEVMHHHRERSFLWGYGHLLVFGSIAATGGGLHVAAYYIEHHSELGALGTVLSVVVPVGVYMLALYVLYALCMHAMDPFHFLLMLGTGAVLVVAVLLAAAGFDMAWCLAVVALAPAVTIVGYETVGHRHLGDHLAQLRA